MDLIVLPFAMIVANTLSSFEIVFECIIFIILVGFTLQSYGECGQENFPYCKNIVKKNRIRSKDVLMI